MRRITAFLLGLAMAMPPAAIASPPTAAEILKKVAETYKHLRSFHFVGDSPDDPDSKVDLAESRPGKVRLRLTGSQEDFLLVSNGETTWTLLGRRHKYTEVAATPLFEEVWEPSFENTDDVLTRARAMFLHPYMDLTWVGADAKLSGEKQLKIAGTRTDCYVLTYRNEDSRGQLWVEKDNFLVLRDGDFKLKQAEVGPLPDEMFSFVPPDNAKRVQLEG